MNWYLGVAVGQQLAEKAHIPLLPKLRLRCFFTGLLFLRQMALLRFFLPPYATAWFSPMSVKFLQTGSFEERSTDWVTALRQELAVFGAQLNPAQQKMLVMTLLSAIVKLLGNINNLKGINDSKINSNLSMQRPNVDLVSYYSLLESVYLEMIKLLTLKKQLMCCFSFLDKPVYTTDCWPTLTSNMAAPSTCPA